MLVTVLPRLATPGWKSQDQTEVPYCEVKDLKAALYTEYPSDALFGNYFLQKVETKEIATEQPRLSKSILPHLKQSGIACFCRYWVVDWDTPGHVPWEDESFLLFYDQLSRGCNEKVPFWSTWYAFYTTPKGCRFIYLLDKDTEVEDSEEKHKGFLIEASKYLNIQGKNVDFNSDWNRHFYLPNIVKNGIAIQSSPIGSNFSHFLYVNDEAKELDPSQTSSFTPALFSHVPISISYGSYPEPEEYIAKNQIWDVSPSGAVIESRWQKDAKKRLRGRECYPCLFESELIAPPGKRDMTLTRYVGQAVSLLLPIPDTTPEKIYALFLPAVDELIPDPSTPNWKKTLWEKIIRFMEQEQSREEVSKSEKLSVFETIVEKMREWCDDPVLKKGSLAEVATFIQKHLIVATSKDSFYVMKPEGVYSTLAVPPPLLIPHIKQLGMRDFISIERVTRGGEVVYRSSQDILNDYGVVVKRMEGVVGKSPDSTAWISDLGKDTSTFHVPMFYLRTDLEPTYDIEVDEWLAAMEADSPFPSIRHWLSHAPDLSRPIAALSLRGCPGVGKKLLAYGIAECFSNQTVCDSREFGRFADGLLRTPIVLINEGLRKSSEGMNAADIFRMLVTGDLGPVEFKYKGTQVIKCPYRVIITSNNLHLLEILAGKEEFSLDDRNAIGERVLHVEVSDMAAEHLKDKGGYAFTSAKNRKWIAGDDGSPSDYRVAKHIMWLYQNRDMSTVSDRFLVKGDPYASYLQAATLDLGLAPIIVETILRALATPGTQKGINIDEDTQIVSCSPYSILEFYRNRLRHHFNIPLSHTKIKQVLQRLSFKKGEGDDGMYYVHYPLIKQQSSEYGYPLNPIPEKQDLPKFPYPNA